MEGHPRMGEEHGVEGKNGKLLELIQHVLSIARAAQESLGGSFRDVYWIHQAQSPLGWSHTKNDRLGAGSQRYSGALRFGSDQGVFSS